MDVGHFSENENPLHREFEQLLLLGDRDGIGHRLLGLWWCSGEDERTDAFGGLYAAGVFTHVP